MIPLITVNKELLENTKKPPAVNATGFAEFVDKCAKIRLTCIGFIRLGLTCIRDDVRTELNEIEQLSTFPKLRKIIPVRNMNAKKLIVKIKESTLSTFSDPM
jgi:hypothetical protein